MPVRQFLSTISPVIAREPAVFVEAMANTCNVEEASGAMGSGRPIVLLKPKVGTIYTQTSYQSALVAIPLSDQTRWPHSCMPRSQSQGESPVCAG